MKKQNIRFTAISLLAILSISLIISSETAKSGVVQGNDSIYTFNVTDCVADKISVGCNATIITFNCTFNPYSFIDEVQFYIQNTYYTTERNNDNFWYTYSKTADFSDINSTISMTRQKITDVDNKSVLDFETVSIAHECDVCDATYNVTYGSCYTNNTKDAQYISNDPCASDYNTTVYCNYCDPDWVIRSGGIYECNTSNQKFVFYDDFNTCYAITGLSEDAPPIDHNTTTSCNYYSTDMTCDVDSNPYLTKKINVVCTIPPTYTNETFNCITYIKPTLNSTELLQSNPEYKSLGVKSSLISFTSAEQEPKEFFEPQQNILNAYYTNKNIETDRTFIVGIKCSSETTDLTSEYPVIPTYKGLSTTINRMIWLKDNVAFVILFLIFFIFAIWLIIWVLKKGVGK